MTVGKPRLSPFQKRLSRPLVGSLGHLVIFLWSLGVVLLTQLRGGFLLASAGCSSRPWDQSFRQEMRRIFPGRNLTKIGMDHPIFHTVFDIRAVTLKQGGTTQLEGLEIEGKIVVIYSSEGLNDTGNAGQDGSRKCCCCGGNEIKNSQEINVNIFTYALTH